MTPLALSALTDVLLACEVFLLAGLSFRPDVEAGSAAWVWAVTLLLIGVGTMLGAVDHGFYQPIDHPAHRWLTFATRVTVALAAFAMLQATARQFLGRRGRLASLLAGLAGLAAAVVGLYLSDNFLIVIACYTLVLLLTLALHLRHLRSARGSTAICVGILIVLAASALGPLGSDGLPQLGLYATYHVILMPGALALFLGGRRLDRTWPSRA